MSVPVIVMCDVSPRSGESSQQLEARVPDLIKTTAHEVLDRYSAHIEDWNSSYAPKGEAFVILFNWFIRERPVALDVGNFTKTAWNRAAWGE
jgi:hypothetical protein